MLHDCAKSRRNGTAPAASPSKLRNGLPSTVSVRGQSTVRSTSRPGAQQRGRRDDLERRAGRVEAGQRAVVGRVRRAVGDGEDVARRRLDGNERRVALDRRERLLGGRLHAEVERRTQRLGAPARPLEQRLARGAGLAIADHDPAGRGAAEPLLVGGLEARLADLRRRGRATASSRAARPSPARRCRAARGRTSWSAAAATCARSATRRGPRRGLRRRGRSRPGAA